MTEKEAWLWLAKCWDNAKWTRWTNTRKMLRPEGNYTYESGLCDSVEMRFVEVSGSSSLGCRMMKRLAKFSPYETIDPCKYWWTLGRAGARSRVLVCLFLAAMCE